MKKYTKALYDYLNTEPKLSKIFRDSLQDLKHYEQTKKTLDGVNISINMEDWIRSRNNSCEVCLAGTFLVGTLNKGYVKDFLGKSYATLKAMFGEKVTYLVSAIDCLRAGYIYDAINSIRVILPSEQYTNVIMNWEDSTFIPVTDYINNQQQWYRDMEKILTKLEKLGI